MLLKKVHKINVQRFLCNLRTNTNLKISNTKKNSTNYLRTKLLQPTYLSNLSQNRNYTSNRTENLKYTSLFPEEKIEVYPSILKILTNAFKLYISLHNKFKIDDFFQGAQQALFVVSTALSNEDYESIKDLVSADVLANLKDAMQNLSAEQKKLIAIKDEDLLLRFIYDVKITFDKNEPKSVQIMVVYHSGHKWQETVQRYLNDSVKNFTQMLISNYQFIYEFDKDESFWIINKINHRLWEC